MFSRPALGTEKDHTGLRGKIVLGLSVVLQLYALYSCFFTVMSSLLLER